MFDWTLVSNDPNDSVARREWKRFYDEKIVKFDLSSNLDRDMRIIDFLSKNTPSKGHVLDVGFAEHGIEYVKHKDWFHRKLREFTNLNIAGLDINAPLVHQIKEQTGYNNLYSGDATDSKYKCGEVLYNTIHAGDIIEHLANFDGFMDFCRRNLTDNGIVILTTPNPCSREAMFSWLNGGLISNLEHTCWVTPTNMNEICRRKGFKFKESHYLKNKPRKLKFKLLKNYYFKRKDVYFTEFTYVLEKSNI